jgi:lipopolysaccharide export system permease protein
MRTLRRYLWREIASATLFVLLSLVGIFALFDLINQMGDLGRSNYQFGHALAFVALLTPAHAYELMPIAALSGTIYALSKLAANSEFTIMRVSGMTTRRLADAVLWVGLGLVALAYLFGEAIAPPAEDLAQRFRSRAIGAPIGQEFRSGVWVRDVLKGGRTHLQDAMPITMGQHFASCAAAVRRERVDRARRRAHMMSLSKLHFKILNPWFILK